MAPWNGPNYSNCLYPVTVLVEIKIEARNDDQLQECLIFMVDRLRKQYWKVWRGSLIRLSGRRSSFVATHFLLKR